MEVDSRSSQKVKGQTYNYEKKLFCLNIMNGWLDLNDTYTDMINIDEPLKLTQGQGDIRQRPVLQLGKNNILPINHEV